MPIVAACAVLLACGLAAIGRWGALAVEAPTWDVPGHPPVSWAVRRYVWTVSSALWTALITAVLIVGPGARLAMRVLAVTAGPGAQGKKTEADEIVGRISSDGTIGIFLFVGLFAGLVSVLTFVVVRRWLPGGRLAGVALGGMLLVVFGSRIDPLRANNPDFDLVGPGWLAITLYGALALAQGMAVVAVAGKVSRWLPLPSTGIRTIAPNMIPLILLIPAFFLIPVVVALGAVVVALGRTRALELARARRTLLAGRVVIAGATAAFLPGFVSAAANIAGRGP